ncbi:MAG TPA: hypothetical protein VF631_10495 [Allosphingosinicella sp.]|jgi:hypothetical protein|uniref:hypothetical protein n=1 Tax=Allosphingosinicella sp. TaxID=2823234 RepID=UPI002F28BCCE
MRHWYLAATAAAVVSACSGSGTEASNEQGAAESNASVQASASGVATPEQLRAVWSSDCSSPFVRIEESKIHVYPDKQTYDLKSAALEGGNFQVSYDTPQGAINETYVVEGDALRLASGTYGGQQATWNKKPMSKCP